MLILQRADRLGEKRICKLNQAGYYLEEETRGNAVLRIVTEPPQ